MTTIITRPTKDDIEEIHRLLSVTIRDTFRNEGVDISHDSETEEIVAEHMQTLPNDLSTGSQQDFFLMAKIESKIIGMAAFGSVNKIIRAHLDIDVKTTPEIKSVYVLPEFQRMGIGSKLFKQILIELRAHSYKRFCLDSGFRSAQEYWKQKLGEPTIILPDYWDKSAHHMIWVMS